MKTLKAIALAALGLSAAVSCSRSGDLTLLVGTYTEGTASEGVYLLKFNPDTGESAVLGSAAAGNPSFLITSADGRLAYGVNEFSDGRQGVSSYSIGPNGIRHIGSKPIPAGGEDPCNILLAGDALVTSNYTGGSLSAFPLEGGGRIGEQSQCWAPSLEGTAHMHCAVLSPEGKFIFATNLGNDCIHRFELGSDGTPLGGETLAWSNADSLRYGPRHLVFSRDGRFAYLICELGDMLVCFSYADGILTPIQTLQAYAGGGHGAADIHLTPDGRFLYTSHRLKDDGIAVFKVDSEAGTVTPAGYTRTGIHPRNFAVTPDGRYLLCACRDSDSIEVYAIEATSGELLPTGHAISLPSPVCVQVL